MSTGAGFLAKAAIDALGHVDIVASRFPATILALVSFDRDGLQIMMILLAE